MSIGDFIKRFKIPLIILLLIIITLVSRELTIGLKVEALRHFFSSFGVLTPIIYIAVFILGEIIPGGSSVNSVLYYIAGFIFNFELAVVFTLIADAVGVTINFLISRYFGEDILKKILSKKQFSGVESFTQTISWELIALFRLVPFITTFGIDIVSYAAGLSDISYIEFLLATLIPWALVNTIQFYSINHFVSTSNAVFLLPVYMVLTVPLGIIILLKRPEYRKFFKELYEEIDILKRIVQFFKNFLRRNN